MMGHQLYIFEVKTTVKWYPRNQDGDAIGDLRRSPHEQKVFVVGPEYDQVMMEAWVRDQFKFDYEDVEIKLLSRERVFVIQKL